MRKVYKFVLKEKKNPVREKKSIEIKIASKLKLKLKFLSFPYEKLYEKLIRKVRKVYKFVLKKEKNSVREKKSIEIKIALKFPSFPYESL